MSGDFKMNALIVGRTSHHRLTRIVFFTAIFSLSICVAMTTAAQSENVRGAHEGMEPGERTDDLGITVPMAPVDYPARRYPATHEFPTGPAIGERLPEFTLPNQNGEAVDFHQSRGDSKAIVVFYRSAVW